MTTYGSEALRRFREQQGSDNDSPMDHNRAQSEGDDETPEVIGIDDEVSGEDDDFETMYEAWVDRGMESGG